jgi:hypothetical protein
MLARSLRRFAVNIADKHFPLNRDQDNDLGTVLKNLEERLFNKRLNRQEARFESLRNQMEKTMENPIMQEYFSSENDRAIKNQSEFRSFKVEHQKEDQEKMITTINKIREKLSIQEEKFFGVKTGAEFDKRSMKFMDAFRLKREVDLDTTNQELDNIYGRFDVYKKNYAELVSSNDAFAENSLDKTNEEFFGNSIRKFVEGLGDQVVDKDFILTTQTAGIRLGGQDYEKPNTGNEEDLTEDDRIRIRKEDYRSQLKVMGAFRQVHNDVFYDGEGFMDYSSRYASIDQRRLSQQARLSIFMMYLEGAKIRDICVRFGIVPQRAKAVIWMQQYFFECVG